jgi:hypothetical protein
VSRGLNRAAQLLGVALLAAAVATELRKLREEREWHGRVAGTVPYEFRPPTLERVRERWWNPNDERLFTEHVFGVGWSVNFARLARLAGLL